MPLPSPSATGVASPSLGPRIWSSRSQTTAGTRRSVAITAKAAAGYAMHGSSRSATRKIARALARESDRDGAGGAAQPGRDGSVEL